MTDERGWGRRNALLAAGAAAFGALGLWPSTARASKWKRLDTALVEMTEARKFLRNAPNVFGGHKKKAIDALTVAIEQIEEAIKVAESK